MPDFEPASDGFRRRIYRIVFLSDTPAGRVFDLTLIAAIVASVVVVMLDSIEALHNNHKAAFLAAEWFFTVVFSVEYLVRLAVVSRPLHYTRSFYGVVDLVSVLPTYVSLFVPGAQVLLVVRILRVLRIFRVLKLATYLSEAETLGQAIASSRRKILVFITFVLTIVTVIGALMYVIESRLPNSDFTSIPRSVYWAVVTLTTVGYGDIAPQTAIGQALALVLMILGYGIIAVPTGIVTVEMNRAMQDQAALAPVAPHVSGPHTAPLEQGEASGRAECPACGLAGLDADARFCKRCGARLGAPAGDARVADARVREAPIRSSAGRGPSS